ncbi:transcription elongation factor GreA [candidate division WWE3 bacterium CG_4_9_14_3_um_filter_41_6]|uniref:Transcription elongation factor GreA n=1 Tax=candidate division WWE3 bacterium CG_4_10_14_0_2_um_filter_41_14 TaxID=1975072 RepID=A0A2M7TKZ0_UNCKA|nr:MAG: transcription elongation factor GreA [candidate division WWE3 bacterium CG_4_10_14_0_2_um_filter_41_14]PJA38835.1 MAG: transcription elongation factor GreA [candidate division WWE3 bacterium CG_4_9_14_3_um_filter_41_6]
MDDKDIVLTPQGFANLTEELDRLIAIERPQIIRQMNEARAMGDLRENAAYHAAREKQAMIQGRILEIQHTLKYAKISERSGDKDMVEIGSTVTVLVNGDEKEFSIVGEQESDIMLGKISVQSPIGSLLIGKRMGESVEVEMPQGVVTYKIVNLK